MSIETYRISKTFGSFKALDDVSITVPTGELVALLGPSGSGKTTLLRIIAGLERPDTPSGGAIRFNCEDVTHRHVRHRRVGFVFQHYALFRHMSVFENIAFGLKVRPRRERLTRADIRSKVEELLHLVQLDGLGRRYPHQLSGGQRQRVALARALATDPKVLLLDEPFGALDAKVRQELRTWLRRLHDEMHVTSVFVTHDQDEAFEVADRVILMHRGRIEQEGSPHHLFHHPKTEFVVNFLGNVNRLNGRLADGSIHVGESRFDIPINGYRDGDEARVFIRPHEIELSTQRNGAQSIEGVVTRVHTAGPGVRIGLLTPTGETLTAEVSHEWNHRLGLKPGNVVYAHPRQARVFIGKPGHPPSPTGQAPNPTLDIGSPPGPSVTI